MLTARILALWGSLAADGAPVANDGGGAGDDDDGAAPFAWPTFGEPPRDGRLFGGDREDGGGAGHPPPPRGPKPPPPSHRDGRDPSRPLSIATGVRHRRAAAGLARARGGFRHVERRWRGTTNIPPPASG